MCAAPQGLVPETVTLRTAPTATDAALPWTPVTVPAEAAPAERTELSRNPAIHFMWTAGASPDPASGLLGAGDAGLRVHLPLRPVDAAPVLAFGDGHPALDAHPHTSFRLGLLREQLLQESHDL